MEITVVASNAIVLSPARQVMLACGHVVAALVGRAVNHAGT